MGGMMIKVLSQIQNWREGGSGRHTTQGALKRMFASHLSEQSAARDTLLAAVDRRTDELVEDDLSWSVDIPTRGHLDWAASVLAAHELLHPLVGDEARSIELLTMATKDEWNTARHRFMAGRLPRALVRHRDRPDLPMNALLAQYGSPWHWRSEEQDDGGFEIFNRRCFYQQFMAAHGAPGLTTIFWSLDSLWMERINSSRCGFSLRELDRTAHGNDGHRRFSLTPVSHSKT
jgi:hypothetical protein